MFHILSKSKLVSNGIYMNGKHLLHFSTNAKSGVKTTSHAYPIFDITSIGSGGSAPQRYRGLPSTLLSLGGENWVFDAGEGTLRQMAQKHGASSIETSRIFITHMHMDHVLGLASLVASSTLRPNNLTNSLHVYGPMGLHRFLCEIYNSTETILHFNVVVHEMVYDEVDEFILWNPDSVIPTSFNQNRTRNRIPHSRWKSRDYERTNQMFSVTEAQKKYMSEYRSKLHNNRNRGQWQQPSIEREFIYNNHRIVDSGDRDGLKNKSRTNSSANPSKRKTFSNKERKSCPVWPLFQDERGTICASLIQHTVPCFGFIIKEFDKSGPIQMQKVKELGIPQDSTLAKLKNGQSVVLSDGRLIKPSDVIDPGSNLRGRKVVILGDTNNAFALKEEALDCDLLVHEATLLPIEHIQGAQGQDAYAASRGHSTAKSAAETAHAFKAKRMLLNHISPQSTFGGIGDRTSDEQLRSQASKVLSDLSPTSNVRKHHVAIARDFTSVSVPVGGYKMSNSDFDVFVPPFVGSH